MKKRILSLILALTMVFSLTTGVTAASETQNTLEFTDMPAVGHWSYNALKSAVEDGLMQGYDGKLMPEGELTRAQMAAMTNRAFGASAMSDISAFTDVKKGIWYYDDMAKAAAMGTFQGSGNEMRPDDPITRQETFTVLARAYGLPDGKAEVLSGFSDSNKISDWAVGPMAAMVSAGYVQGSDGKLNPTARITRAEIAQLMDNMVGDYVTKSGACTKAAKGNLVIRTGGVTLMDMTVSGDLILADGVGTGGVVLDNVTVTGRILVRGGGSSALSLTNGSAAGTILVNKAGAGVKADKESSFDGITVNADNVAVTVKSGTVTAAAGVKGATVNGRELDAGETREVTASSGGTSGGGTNSGGSTQTSVATTSLLLSAPSTALIAGSRGLMTMAREPANANDTVTWDSTDPAVAWADADGFHALSVGSATISAEVNGHISSVTVYVVNPTAADYTITEPGTVLENCDFTTLTIAASVGMGNVTLNNVNADSLVILGGGSNSVEANGGEYAKVEMNSGFDTRLLLDGGAIVGELNNKQPSKVETGSGGAVVSEITSSGDLKLDNTETPKLTVDGAKLTMTGGSVGTVETKGTSTLNLQNGGSISTVQQSGSGSNTTIEGTGSVDKVEASGSLFTNLPVGQIDASGNAAICANDRVGSISGDAKSIDLNGSGNTFVSANAPEVRIAGEGTPVLSGSVDTVELQADQSGSTGVSVSGSVNTINTSGSGTVKEINVGGSSSPDINAAAKVGTVSVTDSAAPKVTGTADAIISDSTGAVDATGADAGQVLAATPALVSAKPGTYTYNATVTLQSIAVTSLPNKVTYRENETLDVTGLVVTGYYSVSGFDQIVSRPVSYTVGGYSFASGGSKTIYVSFGGKSASFPVTVVSKVVDKIAVSKRPTVKTYDLANGIPTLTVSGGELTVSYTSSLYANETVNITNGMCDGFSTAEGSHTITVTYGGKLAFFTVTVINSNRMRFDLALANAKAEFSGYVTGKLLNNVYSAAGTASLTKAYTDGLAALNALRFDDGKTDTDVANTLAAEKAKVDAVKTRSQETDAVVAAFRANYAAILGETVSTVAISDNGGVIAATNAWNGLDAEAQALLTAEKTLLDSLRARIDVLYAELKAAADLAAAKSEAHEALSTAEEDYLAGYERSGSGIAAAKAAGDQAIDAATDPAGVAEALADAISAMAAFKSDRELNEEDIAAAAEEINGYLPAGRKWDDYSAAGKAKINEIRASWAASFDPRDHGGIEQQLADAKAEIDAVKTAGQLSSEALAAAKTAAKAELNAYGDPADYRTAEQTALTNARTAGCANIDAAATETAVAAALAAAKAVIDALKTDEEYTAEELAAAKADAKTAVQSAKQQSNYSAIGWQQIRNKVAAAELAIDACTTAAAVNTVKTESLAALDAITTALQEQAANVTLLANAKTTLEAGTYTAQQADVSSAAQAKAAAETAVAALLNNIDIKTTVSGSFTAPAAGTADDPAGTDGSYAFSVALAAGSATAGYGSTAAAAATDTLTMTVTATPFGGVTNEQAVAAAKTKAEAATYAGTTFTYAGTETAVQNYVRNIAVAAVNDSSITVTVNKVSYVSGADCTAQADGSDGSYRFTLTLAKGTKSAVTKEFSVAITGRRHSFGDPVYSWTKTATGYICTAVRTCSHDGTHSETETVTATSSVTKNPTCTEKGETTYTAVFTNSACTTQTWTCADIDALDHSFGNPLYTWAEDNSTCTAVRTCTRSGCTHKETETVTATSSVTKNPTCTEKGETTYTAVFANTAFAAQSKKTDINATGHSFAVAWSYDETYHWHAATCGHTDEISGKAAHTWNSGSVTKPATSTENGVKTFTCTVCDATRTEVISATNTVVTDYSGFVSALADDTVTGITVNADITVPAQSTWTILDITKPVYVAPGKTLTVAANDAAEKSGVLFNDLAIGGNGSLTLGAGAALATGQYVSEDGEPFYRYAGRVCVEGGTLDVSAGTVAADSFLHFSYGETGTGSNALILGSNAPANLEFAVRNEAQLRAAMADAKCTGGVILENDVTLTDDLTVTKLLLVNDTKTLTVPVGKTLTVAAGGLLQVSGTVKVYGTLVNNGTILNLCFIDVLGGALYNGGTINGCRAGEENNEPVYSSNIGIENGASIYNYIDSTQGTINDYVVAADYFRAGEQVNRTRWYVLEGDHTLDPAGSNFDVMAVGFGTAQVQAALNDLTTWNDQTFGTYEYVMACGTSATEVNTVDLSGLVIPDRQSLLLKGTVYDGTDTYQNTYVLGSGTLTVPEHASLIGLNCTVTVAANANIGAYGAMSFDTLVVNGYVYTETGGMQVNAALTVNAGGTLEIGSGSGLHYNGENAAVIDGTLIRTVRYMNGLGDDDIAVQSVLDGSGITANETMNVLVITEPVTLNGEQTVAVDYIVPADTLTIGSGNLRYKHILAEDERSGDVFNGLIVASRSADPDAQGYFTLMPAAAVTTFADYAAAMANSSVTAILINDNITVPAAPQWTERDITKPVFVAPGKTLTVAAYDTAEKNGVLFNDLVIVLNGSLNLCSGATLETVQHVSGDNEAFYRYSGRVCVDGGVLDVSRGTVAEDSFLNFSYGETGTDSGTVILGNNTPENLEFSVRDEAQLRAAMADDKCTGGVILENDVTLTDDLTVTKLLLVNDTKTLTVPVGKTLTVAAGGLLQVSGTVKVYGTLANEGELFNLGVTDVYGTLVNEGTVSNIRLIDVFGGTVSNSGTIESESLSGGVIALEKGASLYNYIGETEGTVSGEIDLAYYYPMTGEASGTRQEVHVYTKNGVEPVGSCCVPVAVTFSAAQAQAVLSEAGQKYAGVIFSGTNTDAQSTATLSLDGMTVPEGKNLILKGTLFDGTDTYYNRYALSANATLTMEAHSVLTLRGPGRLTIGGTVEIGEDCRFTKDEDFELGGNIVSNAGELAAAMANGGSIYLMPFPLEQKTEVNVGVACFLESQYVLTDDMTVGSATHLIPLDGSIAVVAEGNLTVSAGLTVDCFFINSGELTVTGSGSVLCRGGLLNTDSGSYGPYAVSYQSGESGMVQIHSSYANALAASHDVGKQQYGEGEDSYAVYPAVEIYGAWTVSNLTVNDYDKIVVMDGGSLTINGTLTLGTSHRNGWMVDAGGVHVEKGGSLNYNGTQYTGENGVFSFDEDDAVLMLDGLPMDCASQEHPNGMFGFLMGSFTLNSGKSFTVTNEFDSFIIDSGSVLTVDGTLTNNFGIENRNVIYVRNGTLTNNRQILNDFLGVGHIGIGSSGTFVNTGYIEGNEEWDDNGNHWYSSFVKADYGASFTNTGRIMDCVQLNDYVGAAAANDASVTVSAGSIMSQPENNGANGIAELHYAAVVESTAALQRAIENNKYDIYLPIGSFVLDDDVFIREGKMLFLQTEWTDNSGTRENSLTQNAGKELYISGRVELRSSSTLNGNVFISNDLEGNRGILYLTSFGEEPMTYTINGAVENFGDIYLDGENDMGVLNFNGSYSGGKDGSGALRGYGFVINLGSNFQCQNAGQIGSNLPLNRNASTLAELQAAMNAPFTNCVTLTQTIAIDEALTITKPLYIAAGQTLTVSADVTFRPNVKGNDENGTFLTVPQGASLIVTENGKLSTESDFENNIHAQILLNGGTLIASAGEIHALIDFRSGLLNLPADASKRTDTEVWRRLYGKDCSEEKLAAALADPLVDMIWVRDYMELNGDMTITKQVKVEELDINGNVTVANGGWLEVQGSGYVAVNRDSSLTVQSGGKLVTVTSNDSDGGNGAVYVRGALTLADGASVQGVGNQSVLHLLYDGGTATIGNLAAGTVDYGYIVFNQNDLNAALANPAITYLQINNGNVSHTGDVTLNGDLRISGGQLTIDGDLTVNGGLYLFGGDLTVTGDLTVDGDTEVGYGNRRYSSLTVGGDLTIRSDMYVYGESQNNGASVTVTGDLVKANGAAVVLSTYWNQGFVGYNCTFTATNVVSTPVGVKNLLTNGDGGNTYYLTYFQGNGCFINEDITVSNDVTLNVLDGGVWVEIQKSLTVNEDVTLTIGDGLTLKVDHDVTNYGTIMQIGSFNFSGENYSGTGSVYSPMALRDIARTVYQEFSQYPGLTPVNTETDWYNYGAGYNTIRNWQQFLDNCFHNNDYDAILGMALLLENNILTGEHYAFDTVNETWLKSMLTVFVNKVDASATAKTAALGHISDIELYGADDTLFRGWYDSDSNSFRYQGDEVIRTLRNDLGLYSVEVTTEAQLLAALDRPYVTDIHVPQSMTILGVSDSNDANFDGCCYLNADGRNVNIYLHYVTTLTVGSADHTTKLDVGNNVKIELVRVGNEHAQVVVSEGSCINVFGEMSVIGPDAYEYDEFFTGSISYFGNTYWFTEQLRNVAGRYMTKSVDTAFANDTETLAAYCRMNGWDDNPDFTRLVAYGLTPYTNGQNSWWSPGDPIRYGQAITILTNVYREAYDDDDAVLPASVALGNTYWTPTDDNTLNNRDVEELLNKFMAVLPKTPATNYALELERRDCSQDPNHTCDGNIHELVDGSHNNTLRNLAFTQRVTIDNITELDGDDTWGGSITFASCSFTDDIFITYNPDYEFRVEFDEDCSFAKGVKVRVRPATDASDAELLTNNNVNVYFGCAGGEVISSAPVRVEAADNVSFLFECVNVSGTAGNGDGNRASMFYVCGDDHDDDFDWDANDHSGCIGLVTREYQFVTNGNGTMTVTADVAVQVPVRVAGTVNIAGLTTAQGMEITLHNWNGQNNVNIGSNNVTIVDNCGNEINGSGTVLCTEMDTHVVLNGLMLNPHVFGRNQSGLYLNVQGATTVPTYSLSQWVFDADCGYDVRQSVNFTVKYYDNDSHEYTGKEQDFDITQMTKVHLYPADGSNYSDHAKLVLTVNYGGGSVTFDGIWWKPLSANDFVGLLNEKLALQGDDVLTLNGLGVTGLNGNDYLTYGSAKTILSAAWTAMDGEGTLNVRDIIWDNNYWDELHRWENDPDRDENGSPDNWTRTWYDAEQMARRLCNKLGIGISVTSAQGLLDALEDGWTTINVTDDITIDFGEADEHNPHNIYLNRADGVEQQWINVLPGVTFAVGGESGGNDRVKMDINEGVTVVLCVDGNNPNIHGVLQVNKDSGVNVFGGLETRPNNLPDGAYDTYVVIGEDAYVNYMKRIADFGAKVYDRLLRENLVEELDDDDKATPSVTDCWPEADNEWALNGMSFLRKYAGLRPIARPFDDGGDSEESDYWPSWDFAKYGQVMGMLEAVYQYLTNDSDAELPGTVALGDSNWTPDNNHVLNDNDLDSLLDSFVSALQAAAPKTEVNGAVTLTLHRAENGDEYCTVGTDTTAQSNRISNMHYNDAVTVECDPTYADEHDYVGTLKFDACEFEGGVTIKAVAKNFCVDFSGNCEGEDDEDPVAVTVDAPNGIVDEYNYTLNSNGFYDYRVSLMGVGCADITANTFVHVEDARNADFRLVSATGTLSFSPVDKAYDVDVRWDYWEEGGTLHAEPTVQVNASEDDDELVCVSTLNDDELSGKLRLCGAVDVSGVTLDEDNGGRMELANDRGTSIVDLGDNRIQVNNDCGGSYAFTAENGGVDVCGVNSSAEITLNGVSLGTPHIFGGSTGSIFVGTDNTDVAYRVQQGDNALSVNTDVITDDHKTHLTACQDQPWITGNGGPVQLTVEIRDTGDCATAIWTDLWVKPEDQQGE